MEPQTPQTPTAPASPSTEPAGGGSAPTSMPMGTTPGGQRSAEPTTPAPTTEPSGQGTEGGQEPTATPQNPAEPTTPEGTEPAGQEPAGTEPDYKTKFSESSKEAQRLLQVLKDAGIDPETGKPVNPAPQGTQEPAPTRMDNPSEPAPQQPSAQLTDQQLASVIPGWHNMSEAEKTMLRDTKAFTKSYKQMEKLVTEMYDKEQYNTQFNDLVSNEQWKGLSEYADEFKEYAYKDENLKVPLETLAASFLYSKGQSTAPAPKAPAKPAPQGVEPGSGGGVEGTPKTEAGYTAEEIAKIRTTDPKRYQKLAREGKLKLRS